MVDVPCCIYVSDSICIIRTRFFNNPQSIIHFFVLRFLIISLFNHYIINQSLSNHCRRIFIAEHAFWTTLDQSLILIFCSHTLFLNNPITDPCQNIITQWNFTNIATTSLFRLHENVSHLIYNWLHYLSLEKPTHNMVYWYDCLYIKFNQRCNAIYAITYISHDIIYDLTNVIIYQCIINSFNHYLGQHIQYIVINMQFHLAYLLLYVFE